MFHQLPRSRADAGGPWHRGGPHHLFRWIQAYAVGLEKRIRPHLRMNNSSWRVDETYVKVKGRWMYLYRAVARPSTFCFPPSATLRR